jgi:hypothetical protein
MYRTLLVANKNMVQLIGVMVQRIIYGHDRSAWVSKDRLNFLRNERFQKNFRTGNLFRWLLGNLRLTLRQ